MAELEKQGLCPFCPESLARKGTKPVIKQGAYWHLRENRWPYAHTKLHLLAISNFHAEKLSDLDPEAGKELLTLLQWVEREYKVEGGGIGIRFGAMALAGSTIAHIHAHLIVADPNTAAPGYQRVKFVMGPAPPK